jgi:amidase
MTDPRIHAFCDDVLADHDAVALADLVRRREVSPLELAEAAIARVDKVNGVLNAVEVPDYDQARTRAARSATGLFAGVPSFIKDNTDVAGLPTRHGSRAVGPAPAQKDGAFARQYLAQGFTLLGKTRLPEFGFNGTTEYQGQAPTRNPWNPEYSSGGSSGGAAALVAAGAVPIAHANDGGGSIRIPAACCGLVGLKSTRGRFVTNEMAKTLPVNVVSDGVVTRSVRDTAHFFAGAEQYWRNRKLPEVGLVEGPGRRRLKVGLITDSLTGPTCAETRATLDATVALLERLGHRVELMPLPVPPSFVDDFADYWGFLAFMAGRFGRHSFGKDFDPQQLDGLSLGLAERFRTRGWRLPAVLYRLRRSWHDYAKVLRDYDAVLSPVLGHVTPPIGYISPDVPFEQLFERMMNYVNFTPINNASGSPAISLPVGQSASGLPIAVQFSSAHGAERTLLELAFEIEQAQPWRRIIPA